MLTPRNPAVDYWEVTTIVVVVVHRYLYDYYYLTDHSEMIHGPCRPGRRGKREFVGRLVVTRMEPRS